jgi:hypothetical protein
MRKKLDEEKVRAKIERSRKHGNQYYMTRMKLYHYLTAFECPESFLIDYVDGNAYEVFSNQTLSEDFVRKAIKQAKNPLIIMALCVNKHQLQELFIEELITLWEHDTMKLYPQYDSYFRIFWANLSEDQDLSEEFWIRNIETLNLEDFSKNKIINKAVKEKITALKSLL